MKVLVTGRGAGKTETLLKWVAAGEPVPHYPFWSRVLIVHSVEEVLRLRSIIRADPERPLFEDDAHRVYHLEDWQTAHVRGPIEVAIDNIDLYLHRLIGKGGGHLVAVTMTGEAWEGARG